MDLRKLFEMQKVLDANIAQKQGLSEIPLNNMILATITEIGEMSNDWGGFKHWKVNNQPKPGLLEEIADVTTLDDGMTQKVAAKMGVATIGSTEVPNPVLLKPFRTFVEVTQPESAFILRIRKGPEAALYEADGAAWELNAMQNIKEYLDGELKELIESGTIVIVA